MQNVTGLLPWSAGNRLCSPPRAQARIQLVAFRYQRYERAAWVEAPMDAEALRVQVMGYASLHPSYETMRQRVGWVETPIGAGTHRGQVMGYAALHPSYETMRQRVGWVEAPVGAGTHRGQVRWVTLRFTHPTRL